MEKQTVASVEKLGMANYAEGIMRVPAKSKELMALLAGRSIGETPEGELSTVDLFKAWTSGWDKAHRVAMELKFGF